MSKRNYTHIQTLLPEIQEMIAAAKSQREVAEHFGFWDKYVVKQLLSRECRKEAKLAFGIVPCPKGRPRKGVPQRLLQLYTAFGSSGKRCRSGGENKDATKTL